MNCFFYEFHCGVFQYNNTTYPQVFGIGAVSTSNKIDTFKAIGSDNLSAYFFLEVSEPLQSGIWQLFHEISVFIVVNTGPRMSIFLFLPVT